MHRATAKSLPYQHATMFMFNQSWRARRCNYCHKRFVAEKPNDQHCSENCKLTGRREYKAAHIRSKRQRTKRTTRPRKKI